MGAERSTNRTTAERAITKLKQFRAVAARYDERCYSCLGTTPAAALVIWLCPRSRRSVNTSPGRVQ